VLVDHRSFWRFFIFCHTATGQPLQKSGLMTIGQAKTGPTSVRLILLCPDAGWQGGYDSEIGVGTVDKKDFSSLNERL